MTEKERGKRNRAFIFCALFTIVSLIFEILNYTLEGNPANVQILYITNYGTITVGDAILFFFAKYAFECVNDKKKSNDKVMLIIGIMCAVDFLIQTVGAFTGLSFTIENAQFVAKPLYDSTFITTVVGLAIIKIYLVMNKNYIGKYLYMVFSLYYVFPVITTIILLINPYLSFLLQGVSLALLIVYIGIEKQEKENLLIKLVDRDGLTGLLNRNAWNKKLVDIKNIQNNVGVVFADLNNLKYTNDNLGHIEGDNLINRFTNILKKSFKNDDIFRIGGDEFVIIVENSDVFQTKIDNFKKTVIDNDYIASFGIDIGSPLNIEEVVKKAEEEMYRDKKEYYIRKGIERRRIN